MPAIVVLVYLFPCGAAMSKILDTDRHTTHRNGPGSSASFLLLAAECSLRQGRSGADRQWFDAVLLQKRASADRQTQQEAERRLPVSGKCRCRQPQGCRRIRAENCRYRDIRSGPNA